MGGFLILLALTISTLLWADLTNPYVWIVLLVTVGFGLIGFFDDYRKLTQRSHRGLPGRVKLLLEIVLAAAACVALAYVMPAAARQHDRGAVLQERAVQSRLVLSCRSACSSIVGASNAVNLTDGLDGLAIVPAMIAAGCFALYRLPRRQRRSSPTICSCTTCRGPTS